MKSAWILLLCAGLSVSSHYVTRGITHGMSRVGTRSDRADRVAESQPKALAELREEIARVARETKTLRERIAEFEAESLSPTTPSDVTASEPSAQEIAAALERYLGRHGQPEAEAGHFANDAPTRDPAALAIQDISELPIEDILQLFSSAHFGEGEAERLYQALRDSGRMDEYITALEGLVEKDPDNPELHTALGVAYLQKLFGATPGPESGILATHADQSFDRALELDPTNWGARFTKAVSLSNWPAFLGKTDEAISNFETLIAQQEAIDPEPGFAQSYLFLGNMYQQIGEQEKALRTWRKGLELFPLSAELLAQLTLLDGE